jgi:hypothetical protein
MPALSKTTLVIAALVALVLTACGGGGTPSTSGGGSTTPTPPTVLTPTPSVTLTSSSSSIFQGDSVTLTWSSTSTTSCAASGGWSGSLAAVGSQSVPINSIGTTAFNITCVSGALTANASSNVATTEKPYFVEVPNALIVQMPAGTTSAFNSFAVDINHDGHDDLVIHFWGGLSGQDVGNTPSPNALRIYIYQSNGTFKDQTDDFLHGGFDLGGASYPVKIGDINNDGKPDLIFGITRDDGRLLANVLDNSQMAALVSVGNEYVLKIFGKAGGYHSVGIGYDVENRPYVIGNYYGNDSYYFDSAGNPIPTGLILPSPGFSTFEFYNPKGELLSSSYLLQSSNSGSNYMSVDGFIKNPDQSWSQISSYPLLPRVGSVQGICYTGDVCGTNPVFFINGKYLTFSGIGKSCKIKLNPTSDEIIIFTVAGHVIPNFIDGATVTQNGLPEQYTAMKAVTITNNAIVEVPLNINNEQMVNTNYNYFDCKDMNGDGYSDIVVYPYNSDGIPLVYLNNRDKTFSFIGKANFPQISDSWGNAVSSILHDFDGDGIADLVIFRIDGSASLGPINYHFYKGSKTLR